MRPSRLLIAPLVLASLLGSACNPRKSTGMVVADTVAARQEVEQLMARHYAAFAKGDVDAWTQVMTDSVYLSAADPSPAVVGRRNVRNKMVAEFGPAFAAGLTLTIQPAAHAIWVSEDGRTSASSYELDYVSTFQNKSYPVRLRSSILLARDSAQWHILAAHYSRPIGQDSLFMAVVNQRIPPAGMVESGLPASSDDLMHHFNRDLADISVAPLARNVVLMMPGGGIIEGEQAARRALVEWLGRPGNAKNAGTGARAALSGSGTTGWVATNLNVPIYAGPESGVAPIRALVVYHRNKDRWEIIQAHFSVGLPSRT